MAARSTTTTTTAQLDSLDAWLRAQETKDLVRFVAIGSVDDGKSTLIGRLLHDAHGLYQDQLDAVRRASVRGSTRGAGSTSEIDFSLFTDGLMAEREQGITIDVAYRYFSTEKRKFIIADTPGHVQYTRNMATGASTADVALVLVDARLGVLSQTRRHAQIAALLGIPNVIACVNKMDLVGFDRGKFDGIVEELSEIARRVDLKGLFAIPVSALAGDNVVVPSTRMPWWTGGTMLDRLETLAVADAHRPSAFRLPVQMVLRPGLGYRGFAGQLASGTIETGDEILALPSGKRTRVVGVDVAGTDVGRADAPMSVALRLADDIDVSRGDMLVHPESAPRVATEVVADVVWMSERALDSGKTYLLKHTTRTVRAQLELAEQPVDAVEPASSQPRTLSLNDIGRVRVRCRAPIFIDSYRDNRITGAFILIDSVTNDTVAAGMIASAAAAAEERSSRSRPAGSQVSAAERHERLGQSGSVVRLLAPAIDDARELAFSLERELFDRGHVVTVVDPGGEAAAETCARAGLVALVPAVGTERRARIGDDVLEADSADALVRLVADALGRTRG